MPRLNLTEINTATTQEILLELKNMYPEALDSVCNSALAALARRQTASDEMQTKLVLLRIYTFGISTLFGYGTREHTKQLVNEWDASIPAYEQAKAAVLQQMADMDESLYLTQLGSRLAYLTGGEADVHKYSALNPAPTYNDAQLSQMGYAFPVMAKPLAFNN